MRKYSRKGSGFTIAGLLLTCVTALANKGVLNGATAYAGSNGGNGRPWTAADSASVRYYYDSTFGAREPNVSVPVSPDGKYLYFLSNYGDPEDDTSVNIMTVFTVSSIMERLGQSDAEDVTPIAKIDMRTRHPLGYAIDSGTTGIQWTEDGLGFLGTDTSGNQQIYRLRLPSGNLDALTNGTERKFFFHIQGDTVLYRRNSTATVSSVAKYPIIAPFREAGKYRIPKAERSVAIEWVVQWRGGEPWVIPNLDSIRVRAWFSNSGEKVVVLSQPSDGKGSPAFLLIDVRARRITCLGAASQRSKRQTEHVLWSADGRKVLVAGLSAAGPSDANIVLIDLESDQRSVVNPFPANEPLDWKLISVEPGTQSLAVGKANSSSDVALLEFKNSSLNIRVPFTETLSLLNQQGKVADVPEGLTIYVKQDVNTPPMVVASNGKREIVLSTPDPALVGVDRIEVEHFSWNTRSNGLQQGTLSLPRSFRAGQPVPLVIQATQFDAGVFNPDGGAPTAYAQQLMLARGLAVLNLPYRVGDAYGTHREGPAFVESVDAAIEALANRGIVDVGRVGLVGFSMGGYFSFYAATHPGRFSIGAVISADADNFCFTRYLSDTLAGVPSSAYERHFNGGFWANKEQWLESELLFNVDRMTAPALFVANRGTGSSQANMEQTHMANIAALQLAGRTFDYFFIPNGVHALALPRQRMASLDATADWMCFWLKGETPSDPERAARWAILRKQQDEVLKTPPPPKGKWVFQPDPVQPEWHPPAETKKEEPKPEPTGANKN